jgi:uncharacterized protein
MKKLLNLIDNKIKRFIDFYIDKTFNYKKIFLLAFTVLTFVFIFFSLNLKLKTSFEALLPQKAESVKVLHEYLDRAGGINRLVVVVETKNFNKGKKFVLDFVEKIKKLPKNLIKIIDYNTNDIKEYYKNNFLFYMDFKDLKDLNKKIENKIKCEKEKNNVFNLNLMGNKKEKKCNEFSMASLEKDYNKKIKENKYKEGFYTNKDATLLAITIIPNVSSLSFKKATKFNDTIEGIIKELNPKSYSADMTVGTTGNMKSRVEEHRAIKHDILSTALLVAGLVALSIFIFFLNMSSIVILIINLGYAIAWTLGISYFWVGNLNSQTAFLTSIIVGTGVNYGIILLFRLLEELENEVNIKEAIKIALKNTYIPTFLAAFTTCISFMSLTIAKSSGFSEFGFIGSLGIIFSWIFTMVLIPILIFNFNKISFLKFKKRNKFKINLYISNFILKFIKQKKWMITIGVGVFTIGIISFINYVPNSMEYNFSKLRNKKSATSGTSKLAKKVEKVFSQNLTPSVILTDSKKEAKILCDMIKKENKNDPKGSKFRTFGRCLSLSGLLPKEQNKKLPIISKIKQNLENRSLQWLNDKDYDAVTELRSKIKNRPLKIKDLPRNFKENFKELNEDIGKIVYIEQNKDYQLVLRKNLMEYANTIREIDLPSGKKIKSSGEWVIFADLLSLVKEDIPVVSIFAFSLVFLILFFLTGSIRASTVIIGAMIFSISTMLGIMGIIDMKINFFNFIALPLTLGVGVDYPLNIYTRYKIDKYKNFNNVIKNTGGAVILCSITTIVSYSILTIANSQALASFGRVALIGEFCSIYSALFIIPLLHNVINKRNGSSEKI